MAKWECGLCGYIYDDEKEGTPLEVTIAIVAQPKMHSER